jgi:hypothetical protein
MSLFYTSEELIDSVKRRISIPTNQNTFSDADILAFADEETMLAIVPAIIALHEDYLLFQEDVALEAGKSDYVIPHRAVGNKLYDLQYIDENGNATIMSRSTAANKPYSGSYDATPYSYYVMNNKVVLMPNIGGSVMGSLRFIYYIRPSSLVASTKIGVISDIDRATGVVAVTSFPSAFGASLTYDFYKSQSPHNILAKDLAVSSINANAKTLTFDIADLPDDLAVGDHVSIGQQCAIPQIPSDLHVYLAQKTAERILESQGDLEGLKLAQSKSAEMESRAGTIIDNRVVESPVKLINHSSPLRGGARGFRRRGY